MSRLNAEPVRRQDDDYDDLDSEDMEENEASEVEFEVDAELEKDETEEELEQAVFGDSVGFRERLRSFVPEDGEGGKDSKQATGLEGLDDADVGQALDEVQILIAVS